MRLITSCFQVQRIPQSVNQTENNFKSHQAIQTLTARSFDFGYRDKIQSAHIFADANDLRCKDILP